MERTLSQYDTEILACRNLFVKKTIDYGTSWRVLRPSSLTDQLLIKVKRIRTIQMLGSQKVSDPVKQEYQGIVNYSILALIQLSLPENNQFDLPTDEALVLYDTQVSKARKLMTDKNHDYGEVWREMRLSSLIDIMLTKLLRIKQIEDNEGKTSISEGVDSNYQDILNYAVFSLIKWSEQSEI
ncbi:MAG: DUF1599 domain-containing protein [Bacteroidota bacterium]